MKSFVKKGTEVQIKQAAQDKAIDFIKGGNIEGLAKMLEEGSKESKFLNRLHTKSGKSSLMVAAEEGRIECVQLLLDNFVIVDQVDRAGYTAFLYAALKGETEIVDMLIKGGADINMTSGFLKENAILLAVQGNHLKTVELLQEKGVNIDLENKLSETALQCSIKFQYFKISAFLLQHGADINHVGENKNTGLIRCAFDGRTESAKFIIENGGDVNARNFNGESALMIACKHNNLPLIRLLLDSGADVNAADNSGKTSLMICCMMMRFNALHYILEWSHTSNTFDIHTSSDNADTADTTNDTASNTNHTGTGLNINAVDVWGYSAIVYVVNASLFATLGRDLETDAAENAAKEDAIDMLVAHGAWVNLMDRNYQTPLMHACIKERVEVAEVLLRHGADPFLTNIDDKTALELLPPTPEKLEKSEEKESEPSTAAPEFVMPGPMTIILPSGEQLDFSNLIATPEDDIVTQEFLKDGIKLPPPAVAPALSARERYLLAVEKYGESNRDRDDKAQGVRRKPGWLRVVNSNVDPFPEEEVSASGEEKKEAEESKQ